MELSLTAQLSVSRRHPGLPWPQPPHRSLSQMSIWMRPLTILPLTSPEKRKSWRGWITWQVRQMHSNPTNPFVFVFFKSKKKKTLLIISFIFFQPLIHHLYEMSSAQPPTTPSPCTGPLRTSLVSRLMNCSTLSTRARPTSSVSITLKYSVLYGVPFTIFCFPLHCLQHCVIFWRIGIEFAVQN